MTLETVEVVEVPRASLDRLERVLARGIHCELCSRGALQEALVLLRVIADPPLTTVTKEAA